MKYTIETLHADTLTQLSMYTQLINGQTHNHQRIASMMLMQNGLSTAVLHHYFPLKHEEKPSDVRQRVRDELKTYLEEQGLRLLYVHQAPSPIIDGDTIVGFLAVRIVTVEICIELFGHPEFVADVKAFAEQTYPAVKVPILSRLLNREGDRITTMVETVAMRDELPNIGDFYPYLDCTPAQLWVDFAASNSNVLLLIGPPGTGKSTFILEMLRTRGWEQEAYIVDQQSVLLNPRLPDYIRDSLANQVVITEDSDQLVAKRSEGNPLMSALLNTTAGIISNKTKLIISTNLESLRHVDEALIRPGRTFKILHFGTLTPEQANVARSAIGLNAVEFAGPLTLAEALNHEEVQGEVRKGQVIGFR